MKKSMEAQPIGAYTVSCDSGGVLAILDMEIFNTVDAFGNFAG